MKKQNDIPKSRKIESLGKEDHYDYGKQQASKNRETQDAPASQLKRIVSWHDSLSEANKERNKYWDSDGKVTLSFRGNELAGETGEACNIVKKLERERIGIRGSRATKEQLAEELADVVICADLIAMELGINLDNEVRNKFNATSDKYNLPVKMNSAS